MITVCVVFTTATAITPGANGFELRRTMHKLGEATNPLNRRCAMRLEAPGTEPVAIPDFLEGFYESVLPQSPLVEKADPWKKSNVKRIEKNMEVLQELYSAITPSSTEPL